MIIDLDNDAQLQAGLLGQGCDKGMEAYQIRSVVGQVTCGNCGLWLPSTCLNASQQPSHTLAAPEHNEDIIAPVCSHDSIRSPIHSRWHNEIFSDFVLDPLG